MNYSRSQRPLGLRRGSAAARLRVLCLLSSKKRYLRRTDHSFRRVLPSVMCRIVIEEPHSKGLGLQGLSSLDKIINFCGQYEYTRCMEPGQHSLYSKSLLVDSPVIEYRGGEIFHIRPDRPWGPLSLLYNGYRVIPRCKAAGEWRWPSTLI
jgi:hypothetical protein